MSEKTPSDDGLTAEAICVLSLFSVTAASLLLINKLVMLHIPLPSFVSTLQFVVTAVWSYGWMLSGNAPMETWEWKKVKAYFYYTAMFVGSIYSNMKALQHSNVETIIVFRACCPLIVSILEWGFLDRTLPSGRSWLALFVLSGGCAGYVLSDRAFKMNGIEAYTWVVVYFLIISVEMAYGKHIVGKHLGFASMWGPTLYTNFLSTPVMALVGLLTNEQAKLAHVVWSPVALGLLLLSCINGVAISYLGWKGRNLVSAGCYTVVGVANKMATVLVNTLMWDQHASVVGILFLIVCLGGAAGYQQAPVAAEVSEQGQRPKRRALIVVLALCLSGGGAAFGLSRSGALPAAAPSPPLPTLLRHEARGTNVIPHRHATHDPHASGSVGSSSTDANPHHSPRQTYHHAHAHRQQSQPRGAGTASTAVKAVTHSPAIKQPKAKNHVNEPTGR